MLICLNSFFSCYEECHTVLYQSLAAMLNQQLQNDLGYFIRDWRDSVDTFIKEYRPR